MFPWIALYDRDPPYNGKPETVPVYSFKCAPYPRPRRRASDRAASITSFPFWQVPLPICRQQDRRAVEPRGSSRKNARRLQGPGRLTTQIAQTLNEVLSRAESPWSSRPSTCACLCGVEKQNSKAVTSAMLGRVPAPGDPRRVHGADQVAGQPRPVRLAGQVALVTGAGRGIGRAVAAVFAREGAFVVLAARSTRELASIQHEIETAGRRALVVPTDVRQEPAVAALVTRALAEGGRIDCLVTAAGLAAFGLVADAKTEEWDQLIAVNLRGAFLCCRAVLPAMTAQGRGTIINVGPSSPVGLFRAAAPTRPPSTASWASRGSWPRRCGLTGCAWACCRQGQRTPRSGMPCPSRPTGRSCSNLR